MIITYMGTHEEDLKDGVKEKLTRIGGELLILAEYWDPFMEKVETTWTEVEDRRKAEEEEKKKAEEKEKSEE